MTDRYSSNLLKTNSQCTVPFSLVIFYALFVSNSFFVGFRVDLRRRIIWPYISHLAYVMHSLSIAGGRGCPTVDAMVRPSHKSSTDDRRRRRRSAATESIGAGPENFGTQIRSWMNGGGDYGRTTVAVDSVAASAAAAADVTAMTWDSDVRRRRRRVNQRT